MEEYFYVSFCVAISFFIFKLVLNKIKKNQNNETNQNQNADVMRDSFYIFIITFLVIYFYTNYIK